ncbi:uncharacterized protein LOC105843550 [Hydra vulgaris]|uniref:Uncharacterized protein LOC105843550 n=1 Tax=Hydra vulgaris TaxID=6087 RepID=A0ABM4CHB2_HYDVU
MEIQAVIFLSVCGFFVLALVLLFCFLKYREKSHSTYEEIAKDDELDEEFPIPDYNKSMLSLESKDGIEKKNDSEEQLSEVKTDKNISDEEFNLQLKFSILFSEEHHFLMLNIIEITGELDKFGCKHLRINLTLLPEKKYRMKTKLISVTNLTNESGKAVSSVKENFKFSNITREKLFNSAFRLRLYGKQKSHLKETCFGEIIAQLADVAQRNDGFETVRNFLPKKE